MNDQITVAGKVLEARGLSNEKLAEMLGHIFCRDGQAPYLREAAGRLARLTEAERERDELRAEVERLRQTARYREMYEQHTHDDLIAVVQGLEAEAERLKAWKQRAIDLKASSALVAFVSTYYDKHTPEAWEALCKLSDEFKAALAGEEEE